MRLSKFLAAALFFGCFLGQLAAQIPTKAELVPCGTAPFLDPRLREIRQHPELLEAAARSNDTLWVGMKIHLVAKDNGLARMSQNRLLDVFCRLNSDFAPSNIHFFFQDDWAMENKSAWFDHATIPAGVQMMQANDVPNALNTYFVGNPAGNCGYNVPYASIAVGLGCAAPTDHTWAHETGHALSLPHPFLGWEGKTYQYNNPTPRTVTYDYTYFHAQPDTILPAPLDTALVELVDKSNCLVAADIHCGTPPDYLSYRWNCDGQGKSTVLQRDPDGVQFYSDGSFFMSYSDDKCSNRFSDDEIASMRDNLLNVKTNYLAWKVAEPVVGTPTLIQPIGGESGSNAGAKLRWTAVPNATQYLVSGSRLPGFQQNQFEFITSDTFATAPPTPLGQTIYWRVRPFNLAYTCAGFSAAEKFFSTTVDAAEEVLENQGVALFPNLLRAGQLPFVSGNFESPKAVRFAVFNALGQVTTEGELTLDKQKVQLPIGRATGLCQAIFWVENRVFARTFLVGLN